ncbi:uncharacterized protein METZ01_LOCUS493789, partial [marine metagenome]
TFENGEDTTAVLSGFTISNGLGEEWPNWEVEQGGGIHCGASPKLKNLIIENNTSYNGGGLWINSSPLLINLIIRDNSCEGGGGGIWMVSTGSPVIINTLIINNSSITPGGGLYVYSGPNPYLINTTLFGNQGDDILINNSLTNITNCLIGSLRLGGDQSFSIQYSCVIDVDTTSYLGSFDAIYNTMLGNIDSDPLFVDASGDDYSLLDYSPAIGTGTTTGAPSTDINGTARPTPSGS